MPLLEQRTMSQLCTASRIFFQLPESSTPYLRIVNLQQHLLLTVSLKFRFNWESCMLSGNTKDGVSIKKNRNTITEREIGTW